MWTDYKLKPEQYLQIRCAKIEVWVKMKKQRISIADKTTDEPLFEVREASSLSEDFGELEWTNNYTYQHELSLRPALPDKAIVLKPKDKSVILPKASVEVQIKLPMWLQLFASPIEPYEQALFDKALERLPDAWFGGENGEAAYALESTLYDDIRPEDLRADEIICPLKLTNNSMELLKINNLCIRSQYLNVYRAANNALFTDRLNVHFRGSMNESQITIDPPKGLFDEKYSLLNAARIPNVKNFVKKSFDFLMSIYLH